jgi:uncharacterized protein (DUF2147 family)
MAGKYGSSSIVIQYDDAPGGTLRNMSAHIREIGGVKVEAITEESHPFGVSWKEKLPTGLAQVADVEITGFYDTTATTGPHVVFMVQSGDRDPQGSTRSFSFAPGDGKTFTCETRLKSYEVLGKVGALTQYKAVVEFTGTGAWA